MSQAEHCAVRWMARTLQACIDEMSAPEQFSAYSGASKSNDSGQF